MTGPGRRSSAPAGSPSRPAVPLIALLTLLLAMLVAVALPLLRPAGWSATVTTQLRPAERTGPSTPYVYDVLSRPVLVATYAAILADPRFAREAGDRLGLAQPRRGQARVQVGQVPRSAFFEVTVTSPRRDDAAALAPGVTQAATRYVQRLDSLYTLAPAPSPAAVPAEALPSAAAGAGYPVELRRLPPYGPRTGVVLVASLLPAWLLAWVLVAAWTALRRKAGLGRRALATLP